MERPYLLHSLRAWRDSLTQLRQKKLADDADILIQHVLDLGIPWESAIPLAQSFIAQADDAVRRPLVPRNRKPMLRLTDQRKSKSLNS